jgi:hypothetical protein
MLVLMLLILSAYKYGPPALKLFVQFLPLVVLGLAPILLFDHYALTLTTGRLLIVLTAAILFSHLWDEGRHFQGQGKPLEKARPKVKVKG